MKDYSGLDTKLEKEIDKSTYITDIETNKRKNEIYLTFADGSEFDNVSLTQANINKIEESLQEQKQFWVQNLPKLVHNQKVGYIKRIAASVVLAAGSGSIAFQNTDNPAIIAAAAGIVFVGGFLMAVNYKIKTGESIHEIKDLQYRDKYEENVENFLKTSPNAYLAFDGNEDNQYRRVDEVYTMMSQGINPNSLFARETGVGLTDEEFKSLVKCDAKQKKLGLTYTDGYRYQPRNPE